MCSETMRERELIQDPILLDTDILCVCVCVYDIYLNVSAEKKCFEEFSAVPQSTRALYPEGMGGESQYIYPILHQKIRAEKCCNVVLDPADSEKKSAQERPKQRSDNQSKSAAQIPPGITLLTY